MGLWTRVCIIPVAHTYVRIWSGSHILKIIFKIHMYIVLVIFYSNVRFHNHMSIVVRFMKLCRYYMYCQSNDKCFGKINYFILVLVISLVREFMYLNMYMYTHMYIMYVYCLHSGAKDPVDRVCSGKQ